MPVGKNCTAKLCLLKEGSVKGHRLQLVSWDMDKYCVGPWNLQKYCLGT